MPTYIGVKIVSAKPMTRGDYNKFRGWELPANENPDDEGFLKDDGAGHIQWDPADTFQRDFCQCDGMTFGLAVEAMKKGMKIERAGWNGRGMYIQLNKAIDFDFSELNQFFTIKNTRNSFDTWVPSISDILAEDWAII